MKKLIKIFNIIVTSSTLLFAADTIDNSHFENLQSFKEIKGTVKGTALIGKNLDLYLVKGVDGSNKPFEVITDKDGNYLILNSKVFDVRNQKAITVPMDVSHLKWKESFTYGTGDKHYYVFIDPECPYSNKFEASWHNIKEDVTLHIFFFNLDLHKKADAITKWILSATSDEERAHRLTMGTNGGKEYKKTKFSEKDMKKFDKIIKEQKSLGLKLGIKGTPTVIDFDGQVTPWTNLINKEK